MNKRITVALLALSVVGYTPTSNAHSFHPYFVRFVAFSIAANVYYEKISKPTKETPRLSSNASIMKRFLHFIKHDIIGHAGNKEGSLRLKSDGEIATEKIKPAGFGGRLYCIIKDLTKLTAVPVFLASILKLTKEYDIHADWLKYFLPIKVIDNSITSSEITLSPVGFDFVPNTPTITS